MADPIIDMRSDTVTKPTAAMRQAIADAEVGDDIYGEDPTINHLEEKVCKLFGKEAAVYACSGTQSNQMGVWSHTERGDELLIERSCHIGIFEAGGPAVLSGVTVRQLDGKNGLLDIEQLEGTLRAPNQHVCPTKLLCLENSTNMGGGRTYSLEQMERVCDWAHDNGLMVHLDGARLFNALTARGYEPSVFCRKIDSISVCFSKGLGCPMGSMLIGTNDLIRKARRARKIFGGALRQSGMMAAAAIYALDHHVDRLSEDHANALLFAENIHELAGIRVDPSQVETNILFFQVDANIATAARISHRLKERGVIINPTGPQTLRAVTHLDVSREDVLQAAAALRLAMQDGSEPESATKSAVTELYTSGSK